MDALTWSQVSAWRLTRHSLLERAGREQFIEVAGRICGLHAQLMSSAELSLWARVEDLSPGVVQAALWEKRTMVKTWLMRGTLHLLPAAELPKYVTALGESVVPFYRRPSWLKYHQVSASELDAILTSIRHTLTGQGITREELADAIAADTGNTRLRELILSGWGALLKPAALSGDICFGPNRGQNVTFVRPAEWLPNWPASGEGPDPAEALKDILRGYLNAYGPATFEDFGRWWGIDPAKAKRLFRALGEELVEVEVEGWQAWALASTLDEIKSTSAEDAVRLLPYFDPYTVSLYRHCLYLLPEAKKDRVYRTQGWIAPVVLVGGRIAGVWEYEKGNGRTSVQIEIFETPATVVQEAIQNEGQRLGRFLGTTVDLQFSD